VRDDSSSTNNGLGKNDGSTNDDLPLILGAVCGGVVLLIALAYIYLRCCRKSQAAAAAMKGDEENAADKDTQSPEEYEEACRREEEEIQRLLAMGKPATPKIFPMSRKRSKSATKKNSTPTTVGSIEEKESPSDLVEAYSSSYVSGDALATDDGTVQDEEKDEEKGGEQGEDEEMGGEQGFEIALQDRMEFKKTQIPVKNLIRDFTEAEKNALAATAAAASSATLVAMAQSNDREHLDNAKDDEKEKSSPKEDNAVGKEEARPSSPSPTIDRQSRPVSPTPSDVFSVDDSLYIEGDSFVASPSVGGDVSKQSSKTHLTSKSHLDDMSVGEPGPLSPGSQRQKNKIAEKLQGRAIGTSNSVKPAVYSGVSVRPRRQSSEYSRGRESLMESERTKPQAEDLSSDRAARPRAEYMPSSGKSNVKNQIERFSSPGSSLSPKEGGRKKVTQDDDMEPTSDAWSGFMNELSRAEEQFFNPPTAESLSRASSSDPSKNSTPSRN
jgi:hypothetical protein